MAQKAMQEQEFAREEALDVGSLKNPRPTCYLKECGYEG